MLAEPGYRISRDAALLEDPGLTPDEMAALSLAAQAWDGPRDGTLGLLKLSVTAGAPDASTPGFAVQRVRLDAAVSAAMDAIERRKVVRFAYRTGGGGPAQEREVEPHGLLFRGTWYLTGMDRARGETRSFKLSRIEGTVKVGTGKGPDFEPPPPAEPRVARGPWEGEEEARIALAPSVAWVVERRTSARVLATRDDGWVELAVPMADVETFAGWLAGYGADAEALDPPALRDAVVAHLRRTLEGV